MKLDKETIKKLRELIVFAVIVVFSFWHLPLIIQGVQRIFDVLYPFLLGAAIAFILNVPMRVLEKWIFHNHYTENKKGLRKLVRPVSLVLTIVLLIGALGLVMFGVIPELGKTLLSLVETIQEFAPVAQQFLEEFFTDNSQIRSALESVNLNIDKVLDSAYSFLQNGMKNLLGSTVSAIGSIVNGVVNFAVAFVFACYILIQKESLAVQVKKILYAFLSEKKVKWCLEVCSLTFRSFSSFLTGQCLEALILGVMFFIAMNIFDLPYDLLVAVLVSITALIPIFGAFIACIIGAFLILMVDPLQALGFVVLFLVLQQIEGNLIYPKVVGSSVGLPSIWVLACVTIGGNLMGVVGMVIFIPLASVFYSLFRSTVYRRLREKHKDAKTFLPSNVVK